MALSLSKRLWTFVSGGLGVGLIAAAGFGWLQMERLSAARDLTASLRGEVSLLTQRVQSDAQLITSRDALIDSQNKAVLAMQQAAEADRTAYKARIAAAEKLAKVQSDRAADIMSRQASTDDELQRSREALKLIQEMVGDSSPQE